jgi:hypothetical protein
VKILQLKSNFIKIDARGHFCVEFMDKKTTIIQEQCKYRNKCEGLTCGIKALEW